MELNWQNGEILVQEQSKRSERGSDNYGSVTQQSIYNFQYDNEDDMASLLPYTLDGLLSDPDITDWLYSTPPSPLSPPYSTHELVPLPRVALEKCMESQSSSNFAYFSRPNWGSSECATSSSMKTVMVVTDNTVQMEPERRVVLETDNSVQVSSGNRPGGGTVVVKSPPGSGGIACASAEPSKKATSATEDLKRKGREANDRECHCEDVDLESADGKMQIESRSTKRSHAAEIHNLSERKRRDRINKKMNTLKELIPGCNKIDNASMLDDAIEYVKSLQMQVEMMSSMVPVMFSGVQQCIPMHTMMGMRMGLGINLGMNWPMVPFPYVPGGSTFQNPATAVANMPPRFYMPPSLMQPPPDPSRIQSTNQTNPSAQNREEVQPYTYNNTEDLYPDNHKSG